MLSGRFLFQQDFDVIAALQFSYSGKTVVILVEFIHSTRTGPGGAIILK